MTISPLPSWIRRIVSAIFNVVAIIILLPFVIFFETYESIDRKFGPKFDEWQNWFAWRPVQLGYHQGPIVWLETIERSRYGSLFLYRRLGDKKIKSQYENQWDAENERC